MHGLAMRRYRHAIAAGMVADMAAPPSGKDDFYIVSTEPGELFTITMLMQMGHYSCRPGIHSMDELPDPRDATASLLHAINGSTGHCRFRRLVGHDVSLPNCSKRCLWTETTAQPPPTSPPLRQTHLQRYAVHPAKPVANVE